MPASAPQITKAVLRLAGAGIGAVAAGPLGAALGGSLGAVFGEHAAKLLEPYADEGGKALSEFAVHYCYDQFLEMREHPPLEAVVQQSLRVALGAIRKAEAAPYADWFDNWDARLSGPAPIQLSDVTKQVAEGELRTAPEQALDHLFRAAMERLDGEARQAASGSLSIAGNHFREMPGELLAILREQLPEPLDRSFRDLLGEPANSRAWIEIDLNFKVYARSKLGAIDEKASKILSIVEKLKPPDSRPPFFAPSAPDYFVGREAEMEALRERLRKSGAVVPLTGMAGLGKTSLALAFAHRYAADFEGVHWITCAGLSLQAATTTLAVQIGIKPDAELKDLLAEVRRRCGERHVLLVLDNVDTNDLAELIPGGRASLIITSRHSGLPFLAKYRSADLGLFTPEDCLNLFREYQLSVNGHEAEYRRLAESLGWLPLGVAVAAGLLKNDVRYTLNRLLRETKLHRLAHGELEIGQLLGSAIGSSPEAPRQLLSAMAICAPSGFRLGLAAEIAAMEESFALDALQDLRSRSLVEEIDRAARRYRLHSLIRVTVGQDASLEQRQAEAVARKFEAWEAHWRECEEDLPDWRLALDWADNSRSERIALLKSLAFSGFLFMRRRGLTAEALRAMQLVSAACEESGDRDNLQASYGNQALILATWGNLEEAMALHKREEAISEESGDSANLQASYGNQALILKAWGKLEEALALLKRQEGICGEMGNRAGLATCYGNQSLILQDWGRLDEAMALLKRQEVTCEELVDRAGLSRSYGNQAFILRAWGKPEEAMALLKRQEAICEEVGDRGDLSRNYGNQAVILEAWGRLEDAMVLLKRQEVTCEELGDRAALQASYCNQALILDDWGKLEEAMALFKRGEAICREIGFRDSLRITLHNQAILLDKMGKLDEATRLRAESATIQAELMRGRDTGAKPAQ